MSLLETSSFTNGTVESGDWIVDLPGLVCSSLGCVSMYTPSVNTYPETAYAHPLLYTSF